MADESPLAGLLDRAGKVFSLARELAEAFNEQGQSRAIFYDPSLWPKYAPAFDAFCAALLDLRDAMQNPPAGFAPVAERLLQAASIAKGIRDKLARDGGFTDYLDAAVELNTVFRDGWEAVKQVSKARRLDDPFAFVDDARRTAAKPAFSLLDRFPATTAGHVAFLEFVRDEVHYAADAKRQQLERGYPNATIESMIRGIYWAEASTRLAALVDLPDEVKAIAGDVLRRELTTGTVEQIDGQLTPAVNALRDAWERIRQPFNGEGRPKMSKKPKLVALKDSSGKFLGYRDSRNTELLGEISGFEPTDPCTQLHRFPEGDYCLRIATTDKRFNTQVEWQPVTADDAARWFIENGVRNGRLPECLADVAERQIVRGVGDRRESTAGTKAGEAFRRMMETDPETRAGVERAKEQLQAFADAMQAAMESPEYKAFQEADRRRWQELANAIAAAKQAAGDELTARHFARPESIEDWEHLARIVEIPAETIRAGNLTAREISACALAWADRQTIKAKLTDDANAGSASEPNVSHDAPPQTDGAGANSAFLDEWTGEIVAATAVVVGKKNNAALSRLIDIAKSKEPAGRRLYMMEKTGLLRADVSASELAKLLRVTPAAVKKTRWWKTRMAQRRSENADANAPYHQRRRPGQRGRRR